MSPGCPALGSGCQLEARPWVTAEELRSGKIARALKGAGQTLIAVFSTDSTFAGSLGGAAAADGFWSDALRLVNVVSTAAWEKKVLGRAQAPGVSPETGKLQVETQGGALAGDGSRGACAEGSQQRLPRAAGASFYFPGSAHRDDTSWISP